MAHCFFGLLLGTVHEVTTSSLYYVILGRTGDFRWEPTYRAYALHALAPAILQRFMEYWTLLVIFIAVDNARQMREKQTQLLKLKNELHISQLNALKKQLQPHFLPLPDAVIDPQARGGEQDGQHQGEHHRHRPAPTAHGRCTWSGHRHLHPGEPDRRRHSTPNWLLFC